MPPDLLQVLEALRFRQEDRFRIYEMSVSDDVGRSYRVANERFPRQTIDSCHFPTSAVVSRLLTIYKDSFPPQ